MSVADCPEQIGEAPEIIGVGRGFTVTVMEVSSEQEALPTVTVYVVFPVGEIVIEAVVAPVLHENDEPPDAVSVILLPAQIEFSPLIVAVILPVTVTVAMADAVQNPFVTLTE